MAVEQQSIKAKRVDTVALDSESPSDQRQWRSSACILCECNCGIEVELGGAKGRDFSRVRGDDSHPASAGYACEKASRVQFYQNDPNRLTQPQRRRPDGTYEAIDWETAIREVTAKLAAVRDQFGGSSIFYYGGAGQGNHLPSVYGRALRSALGVKFQSSALAQEKTGELHVVGNMLGGIVRADFEHCEVALMTPSVRRQPSLRIFIWLLNLGKMFS
jgi:anaerobic selenocysteine-containing dehydrogenase